MDVKVVIDNVLPGSHPSTNNAGIWLREHLNIPSYQPLFTQFEEYFNCRVDVDDRRDSWMEPNKVIFENSADLTAFLLRWS